jgi:hypothetical protein
MSIQEEVITLVNERLDILPCLESCADMTHTAEYEARLDAIDEELQVILNP